MTEKLTKRTVLVLNRHWQAVGVTTPALAFTHMYSGSATALEVTSGFDMIPRTWAEWTALPVRTGDGALGTPRGSLRVPTVIVLARYDKVPLYRPAFGRRGLWLRDEGRCQYTGRPLKPEEANIDHVIPRSRGGLTNWENCVLADRRINSRKADRTPAEAGLALIREPRAPRPVPVTAYLRNDLGIREWEPFLLGS